MPAGWSVQLGSFMQVQNAMRLLKKLEEAGFKASTRQVVIKENSMTQVIVGPVSSYEEAQALKKHLATAVQLEGRVITASLD
jgi:cell division septation protein DedD